MTAPAQAITRGIGFDNRFEKGYEYDKGDGHLFEAPQRAVDTPNNNFIGVNYL